MPGFLNVRVAPGLRLSASGRGLRAHLGPRAARVHFGGGGRGVSTGVGPFTYYKSLEGSRVARQTASAPQSARDAKAAEAERIRAELAAIQGLHRNQFDEPEREMAALPPLPPFLDLLERAEAEHLRGIGLFHRQKRAAARDRAREATERHSRILLGRARQERAEKQAAIDKDWNQLLANDEDTVLHVLESVFDDNQAPAAALGVEGETAFVAVLPPTAESLPLRLPSVTSAGNLSLKKMTKSQQAAWHLTLVAGHVVATAKETLTACPGLKDVTLIALRPAAGTTPAPILVTNLSRHSLSGVRWADVSAWDVVEQCGRETRIRFKGAAQQITDLNPSEVPNLNVLLNAF
jgi:hypothetical protein